MTVSLIQGVFYGLNLGGAIGLIILAVTTVFSRNVKTQPLLINIYVTCIIQNLLACLLFFANRYPIRSVRRIEAGSTLCAVQSVLFTPASISVATAVCILVWHVFFIVYSIEYRPVFARSKPAPIFIALPYIVYTLAMLPLLVTVLLDPTAAKPHPFYCFVDLGWTPKYVGSITGAILILTLGLEVLASVMVVKNITDLWERRRNDLRTLFRVGLFALYIFITFCLSMQAIHNFAACTPDIMVSTIPIAIIGIFGTRKDTFDRWISGLRGIIHIMKGSPQRPHDLRPAGNAPSLPLREGGTGTLFDFAEFLAGNQPRESNIQLSMKQEELLSALRDRSRSLDNTHSFYSAPGPPINHDFLAQTLRHVRSWAAPERHPRFSGTHSHNHYPGAPDTPPPSITTEAPFSTIDNRFTSSAVEPLFFFSPSFAIPESPVSNLPTPPPPGYDWDAHRYYAEPEPMRSRLAAGIDLFVTPPSPPFPLLSTSQALTIPGLVPTPIPELRTKTPRSLESGSQSSDSSLRSRSPRSSRPSSILDDEEGPGPSTR